MAFKCTISGRDWGVFPQDRLAAVCKTASGSCATRGFSNRRFAWVNRG